MGAFIIGILVGWLAEFLFFTFFVKGKTGTNKESDEKISLLQSQLNARSKEVSELKSKLELANTQVSEAKESVARAEKIVVAAAKSSQQAGTAAAAPKPETVKAEAVEKKPATTAPKTKATKKSANKPSAKKAAPKQAEAKKAPAKKTAKAKSAGDDFTLLSGIGPSMNATLKELGIDTFRKLADMDDDILRDMLEASGARLNNNKEAMDSWNEQAELASKGDFDGLKKLQDSLKSNK